MERAAHRFAAEFLTPAKAIAPELPRRVDWRRFAELKVRWGVSIAMLLRRARDLGFISDASYRRAMMELSRRGWRTAEPVDLGTPEQPELLGRAMSLLEARRAFTRSTTWQTTWRSGVTISRRSRWPLREISESIYQSSVRASRPQRGPE